MVGKTKTYTDRNTPYKFRTDWDTRLAAEIYTDCLMRCVTSYGWKVRACGCGPPGAPKGSPTQTVVTDRELGDLLDHAVPQRDGWKSELNIYSPFSTFWAVWRDIHWPFWFWCTGKKSFSLQEWSTEHKRVWLVLYENIQICNVFLGLKNECILRIWKTMDSFSSMHDYPRHHAASL